MTRIEVNSGASSHHKCETVHDRLACDTAPDRPRADPASAFVGYKRLSYRPIDLDLSKLHSTPPL